MRLPAAIAAFIFLSAYGILAQSTATPSASVSSTITISSPYASGSRVYPAPPNHLVLDNKTLRQTIAFAYGLTPECIVGGAVWVDSSKYDMVLDAPVQTAAIERLLPTLQAFLRDRFKLQIHREQRLLPVYYLARSGELRIKPSAEAQNQHALFIQGPPSARAVPGRNATMAELAGLLQRAILNRPVIDRTGLTGRYNFDLEWADRRLSSATDPDIFGAVQQLGLKLEPAQDIVNTIVVDYSEQPTAN
jgi:uncharacterized protein (TIGR03435 family)